MNRKGIQNYISFFVWDYCHFYMFAIEFCENVNSLFLGAFGIRDITCNVASQKKNCDSTEDLPSYSNSHNKYVKMCSV